MKGRYTERMPARPEVAGSSLLGPFGLIPYWDNLRTAKRWWHSFEFPDGTVVEGVCNLAGLKNRIGQFPIPPDLRGKRVLDIGTWDGWYAFEMERRGAEVVAVDCWDNPLFRDAHARFDSRVEYRQMDVYDLTPGRIGRFDIVLFMGVLYHLKHPLLALERVCALTTDLAAVESFILREQYRPGENVERRPVMEFYEADEMGGQTDCWIGPSVTCLMALCRAAGFARVELRNVLEHSASIACHRCWTPANPAKPGPELTGAVHTSNNGINFDTRRDEYVSIWFHSGPGELTLDDVCPQVDSYGVRPLYVGAARESNWQANFKLPPGLTPGWHNVTVRIGDSLPSSPKRIAVDLPLAPGAIELKGLFDAQTWTSNRLDRQKGSLIALSIAGLPENADRNNIQVYLGGRQLSVTLIEKRNGQRYPLVYAEVPPDVPPGPAEVVVAVGGARAGAADLLIDTRLQEVEPMNVVEKVREIRQRIELKTPQEAAMEGNAKRRREELRSLRDSYSILHGLCNAVGTMPPVPPTIRGRIGSWFVHMVQRMLFWYTPQILRFHNETVRTLDSVSQLLELGWKDAENSREQMRQMRDGIAQLLELRSKDAEENREQISRLQLEVLRLRAETVRIANSPVEEPRFPAGEKPAEPGGAGTAAFQFAIQDRFRGSEAEVRRKLEVYLHSIRNIPVPDGPWLDVGCGRGEWIEMAGAAGFRVSGVDSSPASVSYCRSRGLEAIERDAVAHLRALSDNCVAVLTAFHFFEHCTVEYLMALLGEAVRVLAPGGLLICETPDPANVPMGAHLFWRDPTHQRPLPMELLEFMLGYLGLNVIERLYLNPDSPKEQPPPAEMELLTRLDKHFRGSQDYGLVARR